MRKKLLLGAPFVLLLVAMTLWQVSKSRTFQFFGVLVPRIDTAEKVVALTFDDGPTASGTNEILSVLDEMKVKATFFLIGAELEQNMAEGRKIVAAGHEVGNHSYSHVRMLLVTPAFVQQEIKKTDRLIRAAGYDREINFRPPYGKSSSRSPGISPKQAGRPSRGMSSRIPIQRSPLTLGKSLPKPGQACAPAPSFCSMRCIRTGSHPCKPSEG